MCSFTTIILYCNTIQKRAVRLTTASSVLILTAPNVMSVKLTMSQQTVDSVLLKMNQHQDLPLEMEEQKMTVDQHSLTLKLQVCLSHDIVDKVLFTNCYFLSFSNNCRSHNLYNSSDGCVNVYHCTSAKVIL